MAWLAADLDGTVYKYKEKPIMCTDCWMSSDDSEPKEVQMSEVIKVAGKKVTWNNSPIQIK